MDQGSCPRCEGGPEPVAVETGAGVLRVAILGNPNTGKTTLFNRLCGLRHKTGNFPGTTQEARIGVLRTGPENSDPNPVHAGDAPGHLHLIDLPGIYSLKLDQTEAEICREVLAGELAPSGEVLGPPDAACVVVDAANLPRNLALVGEVLAQRLPTVVAVNMVDLARRAGVKIDRAAMEEILGCPVVLCSARSGEGTEQLAAAIRRARIPNRTPPGERHALEEWADQVFMVSTRHAYGGPGSVATAPIAALTDRLDRIFTHPVLGVVIFHAVMGALFFVLFKIAQFPMDLIDSIFGHLGGFLRRAMPPGIFNDLISQGIVGGVGATVIFVPQIALLFFLISLLEDTGYLARAAFVMDRMLRPFGLPGHAFVPLLSSHACALPGIMATRAIPDRRDRLATILVAPFMTCSARIPVYVLVTTILFRDQPLLGALAFIGCYLLGAVAGLFSALVVRRTILPGPTRPMALELPTYKLPSLRTAFLTTYDRSLMFLKNAGTNILAICVVLWWMGSFPRVGPPPEAVELRAQADAALEGGEGSPAPGPGTEQRAEELRARAERLEASNAKANSYAGRLGKFIQPVFEPLGYDWQLTVGVVTSFAAREVFVSTMAVMIAGTEDKQDPGVVRAIREAKRSDGITPVFTTATSWSLLVFYVLAMQCLPTLAVTAKEAGGVRWALLQLAWMTGLAYLAAFAVYRLVLQVSA